jgi:uncharacterized protein (UPF0261 family)
MGNTIAEDITVSRFGPVSDDQTDAARAHLSTVLERAGDPAVSAALTLTLLRDPSLPNPALAQVTARVHGRTVRARAAATSPSEAVALMAERLSTRL